MKITAIMTCFNRKAKTLRCLRCLFDAAEKYKADNDADDFQLSLYLTDDGCTDGTADAVKSQFADKDITIVQGKGNCFWAGGMRLAWRKALASGGSTDFFLLVNDDTFAFPDVFSELLRTDSYCVQHFGRHGMYSGVTCDSHDHSIITYSGDIYDRQGRLHRLHPNGTPQLITMTNANMLLVHASVVDTIGIFYDGYQHGSADNDYSWQATKHGIPVLITAHTCAYCDFDHIGQKAETVKMFSMTVRERKAYVSHPLHSDYDYLTFIKRNMPRKYPLSWVLRKLRVYAPRLYYNICKLRGVY